MVVIGYVRMKGKDIWGSLSILAVTEQAHDLESAR